MLELQAKFFEFQKEFNQIKQKTIKNVINILKQEVCKILTEEIKSIGFTAYTPYTKNAKYEINAEPALIIINNEILYNHPVLRDDRQEIMNDFLKKWNIAFKFVEILKQIPEEIVQITFGESKTTFYRDGSITIEEYLK